MRLHKLIWAILLVLLPTSGRVLAAISLTNDEYYVLEGMPFTITWSNNRGPVTVTLMKGPDANLEQVLVLVTGSPAQEFTWTPPPTLAAGSYELQVEDSGSADYSPRFQYPAPPLPSSSTTSTASGPTNSPTSNSTTIPSSTSTSLPTPPSPSAQPLPIGAIAAIATLGALLAIAILVFLVYCIRKRRRYRVMREAAEAGASYELPLSSVGESHTWSPATTATMHMNMKIGDQQQYERAELSSGRDRADMVELSAEGRHLR